jgi:uncharacterized protein (TIGR00730 family)
MARINKNHFRVTIFGSARLKRNDRIYKQVYNLAKMLAKENIDIVTGGGPGLMDAASRGHYAGGKGNNSHSIGLTIRLPKEQHDAYHLDIKEDFGKFSGRLDTFMKLSNVVVVAPGGVGTILEFFYTWQLVQVHQICEIPIILFGDMWPGLIDWVKKNPLKKKLLNPGDLNNILIVKNSNEVIKIVKHAKKTFESGKHVCNNLSKYK